MVPIRLSPGMMSRTSKGSCNSSAHYCHNRNLQAPRRPVITSALAEFRWGIIEVLGLYPRTRLSVHVRLKAI